MNPRGAPAARRARKGLGLGLGLAVALALIAAACGSDDSDTAATDGPYPPNDFAGLAEIFDPVLEPSGLRLTRGSLIDRTDGGYERSDEGTHLALYAEPIDEYSMEEYVDGIWTITAAVTPTVFDRWSAVDSYDICQEPLPADDSGPEPPPITQVELTRAGFALVDWERDDLSALLALARGNPGVRVTVHETVAESPEYGAAQDEATRRLVPERPTTVPTALPGSTSGSTTG